MYNFSKEEKEALKRTNDFLSSESMQKTVYNNWLKDVQEAKKSYKQYVENTSSNYDAQSHNIRKSHFDNLIKRGENIKNMFSSGSSKIGNAKDIDNSISQLTNMKKGVDDIVEFYRGFGGADNFYDWSFSNKHKGKTVTEIDDLIKNMSNSRRYTNNAQDQRELNWLKSNRDTFMSPSELQAEIKTLEENSASLKKNKWRSGVEFVGTGLSGLNADSAFGTYQKNKTAETENAARLDKLKKLYAGHEDVGAEQLESLYKKADEKNIFSILSPDYSYADYANDKADKYIYGGAYTQKKDKENLEIINKNKYEFDSDVSTVEKIVSLRILASDLASSSVGGNLLKGLNEGSRRKEIMSIDPEIQAIKQKWTDKGYDFESLFETHDRNSNAEYTESITSQRSEYAKENPVLANIESVGTNLVGGVAALPEALESGMKGLFSDDIVSMDTNTSAWALKNVTDAVRDTTTELLSTGEYGNFKKFLYQTGISIADFATTAVATGFAQPATLLVMGSNAAVDSMKTVTERGGSASDAMTMGVLAGVFEAVMEKVPLDTIFKSVNTATGKAWIRNIFNGMMTEGFEELGTDLANNIVDVILNADQSEFSQNVFNYMQNGMSASEASAKVFAETAANMGLSFLGGAISGGGMTAVGGGIGLARANSEYSNIGENVMSHEGSVDTVMEFAKELVAQDDAVANDVKKVEQKKSARNVGRLYADTQNALSVQNRITYIAEAKKGIQARVEKLGLDKSTSKAAADIIYKAYNGEKLTARQQKILKDNKYVARAYRELSSSNTQEGRENYTNSWVQAVNENIENAISPINEKIAMISAYSRENPEAKMTDAQIKKQSATVNGTDENVVINKIVDNTAEGAVVELTDGTKAVVANGSAEAAYKTIALNDSHTTEVIETARKVGSAETATVFMNTIDEHQNVESFNNDFSDAYLHGLQGKKLDTSEYEIAPEQAKAAFEAGKNDAKITSQGRSGGRVDGMYLENIIKTTDYSSGVTRLDTSTKLNGTKQRQLDILNVYGKKHNLSFITVDTINNSNTNGYFVGKNKIVLSLDAEADAILSVAGHETYHYIEKNSEEGAAALRAWVMDRLKNDNNYNYAERFDKLAKRYGTDNLDQIESEMVANAMFEVLANEEFVNELAEENPGLFKKIYNAIATFIKEIKNAIQALAWDEAVVLRNDTQSLNAIKQLFDAAMANIETKNTANDDGEVKMSLVGKTQEGIEVYETSEKNKKLSYIEKLAIFKQSFYEPTSPNFIGTKIGFIISGKQYYAEIDRFAVNENINKINPKNLNQWDKAKINIGAEGDFVNLVENVHYDRTSINQNRHKNDAHKKTESFDYFYKTVFIDRIPFEVVVNIRNEHNLNKFLYEVKLKKIKDSQLEHQLEKYYSQRRSKVKNTRLSESFVDNITQNNNSVNTHSMQDSKNDTSKFSLKETNEKYISAVESGDMEVAQKLVDEAAEQAGYNIRAYHGTSRGDRVGNVFLPERATSGPMAFFTSNKDIAGNYARDKADTSLAYDEEYEDYYSQFRVNYNGKSISVSEYWNKLSFAEKQKIKEKAKHVTFDDEAENIIYDESVQYGAGGFDAYRLNTNNGNALAALTEEWLVDGNLYGEEEKFLEVMKLVGIDNVEYRNPNVRHEKVYDTYLKIENPFRTEDVDSSFADSFLEWYDSQDVEKYERETANADMWDKNNITAEEWVEEKLRDDIENGTSRSWTMIPDAVTDYLKSLGHDGIFDTGGKGGGESHTVYIPFASSQIKSAEAVTYDDNGEIIPLEKRFNEEKPDIRFSLKETADSAAVREQLLKDNDNLRVANALLKKELKLTQGKMLSYDTAKDIAKYLTSEYSSHYDTTRLSREIYNIFNHYDKTGDYDYLMNYLATIGKRVVARSSAVDNSLYEDYEDCRKWVRNMEFTLPEQVLRQLNENYDGQFVKKTFGRMRYVSRATHPDAPFLSQIYSELANEYPNFFSIEDNEYEQPMRLIEFWEKIQPTYYNPLNEMGYASEEDAAVGFAFDVFKAYSEADKLETFADKKQNEIKKLQKEYNRNLDRVKKKMSAERDSRLEYQKEYYINAREKSYDGRKKAYVKKKIRNVIKDLNKYLNRGSKDKNVKDGLQETVQTALSAAELLFSEVPSNEDIVRAGVSSYTQREAEWLDEYEGLLNKREEYRNQYSENNKSQMSSEFLETREKLNLLMDNVNKRIKYLDKCLEELFEREKRRLEQATVSEALSKLASTYSKIKDSEYSYVAQAYNQNVYDKISDIIDKKGDAKISLLSTKELDDIYVVYKMVLHTVRNANKIFTSEKQETAEHLGQLVMQEIRFVAGNKKRRVQALEFLKKFGWSELKPIYAFRLIGSDILRERYSAMRHGEDTYYRDVSHAKEFYAQLRDKYKTDEWQLDKGYEFYSKAGEKFTLSLEQIMSIYAYCRRGEQAVTHLVRGGFVFSDAITVEEKKKGKVIKYKVDDGAAYSLTPEILAEINHVLDDNKRAFVEEMQFYLSDIMGEKGNEVSMKMYGIKQFNEKNYFPLKSSAFYRAFDGKVEGEASLKNAGFSKATTPKANNPIVLDDFTNVWSNHVQDMAMYHSFVLPIEDFTKVFNYETHGSEDSRSVSVKATLQGAYGPAAEQYVRALLTDLNSGVRSQSGAEFVNKLTSLAKKGAVFASMSVVAQQPSAVIRAMAHINTKCFIGAFPKSANWFKVGKEYDEIKKYAPVAGIKEMGYFDTGLGKSTAEWIAEQEYRGFGKKFNAFFKDGSYRDDVFSVLASKADEISWVYIWNAVKKEVAEKQKLSGEELNVAAGKRFTEVIELTQVYDSVFSRSGLMRSKDTGVKMATSFMSEPTTQVNMLVDAFIQGKRGNKKYTAVAIGSVYASILVNAILKSIVTAGRDDDDELSFAEKYVGNLVSSFITDGSIVSSIPFARDVISLVQGYDVERMDMTVIADMINAFKALSSDKKSTLEKVTGLATSLFGIIGVPAKNIYKDINAVFNTYETISRNYKYSPGAMKESIKRSVTGKSTAKADLLYSAIVSGDTEYAERLKGMFETESGYNTAVRAALKKYDDRIHEAAEARMNGNTAEYMRLAKEIIAEKNFSQDNIVAAINSVANTLKEDDKPETDKKKKGIFDDTDYFDAILGGDGKTADVVGKDLVDIDVSNGKTREDAEKSLKSSLKNNVRDAYDGGVIDNKTAFDILTKYGGMTAEEAESRIQYWDFKSDYPDIDLSEETVTKYYKEISLSGISVEVFYSYYEKQKACKGVKNEDGKTISGSKKEQILKVIDELPITSKQKDVLYFQNNWSESTLYEAPWH